MSGGTTFTSTRIAGSITATTLMNRVGQYFKRTGRMPKTLNLTRDEYNMLMRATSITDMGSFLAPNGKASMWRGFTLRIRNYDRERLAKERKILGGMVRIPRRRRPRLNVLSSLALGNGQSTT